MARGLATGGILYVGARGCCGGGLAGAALYGGEMTSTVAKGLDCGDVGSAYQDCCCCGSAACHGGETTSTGFQAVDCGVGGSATGTGTGTGTGGGEAAAGAGSASCGRPGILSCTSFQ